MITIKAGCILINMETKRIALVCRKGEFSFPKGHLEEGEKIEECAIRETIEETGHECHLIKEIAKINYFNETQLISEERAEMICYMFCHKYKIENSLENSDKIIGIFKEDEIVDIKNDLSTIKDIYDQITIQMDQYLEMDRRERKDNERNER